MGLVPARLVADKEAAFAFPGQQLFQLLEVFFAGAMAYILGVTDCLVRLAVSGRLLRPAACSCACLFFSGFFVLLSHRNSVPRSAALI